MSAYLPLDDPGFKLTMSASAPVTGGQLVYISGSKTVAPTTGAVNGWLGVALNDALAGGQVAVVRVGVHLLTASGSITAGDLVIPAASGQVADIGTVSTANSVQVVGKALTSATNGNPVTVAF